MMMDLNIGLKTILKKGVITNELDFQRAFVLDRKLRLMIKEQPELAEDRKQLRTLLKAYEDENWNAKKITNQKVDESNWAEQVAERESIFLEQRKKSIKLKLKEAGLTQKDLGFILGHTSATYVSELVNGINPFTLNDLIVIHNLLNIELENLIPTVLPLQVQNRIINTISKLKNPNLNFKTDRFVVS